MNQIEQLEIAKSILNELAPLHRAIIKSAIGYAEKENNYSDLNEYLPRFLERVESNRFARKKKRELAREQDEEDAQNINHDDALKSFKKNEKEIEKLKAKNLKLNSSYYQGMTRARITTLNARTGTNAEQISLLEKQNRRIVRLLKLAGCVLDDGMMTKYDSLSNYNIDGEYDPVD